MVAAELVVTLTLNVIVPNCHVRRLLCDCYLIETIAMVLCA